MKGKALALILSLVLLAVALSACSTEQPIDVPQSHRSPRRSSARTPVRCVTSSITIPGR